MAETGYNPWRDLRGRPHIRFRLAALPEPLEGVYGRRGDRAAIIISSGLSRRERRVALAHELVHDDRDGGCDHPGMPKAWLAVVTRDEDAVDDEVAARLVPIDELAEFCSRQVGLGHGVTAAAVAEHFDVTEQVAARAVKLWVDRR